MDWFPFILFPAFILLAVGVVALGYRQQRKRTEAWQRVAGELGIEFLGDASDVLARCGQMKVFSQGRSRRFTNAVCGDAGDVRITLGDFRYVTGSGKNSHTHHRTVCVLESNRLELPHCYLRPESLIFDSIGSLFGGQDIDFAEDPQFSRAYVLQGPTEQAIRAVFDADTREWFAARRGRGFHFEARGGTLVFHTGKRHPPEDAKDLMQQGLEIMGLLAKG